MHCRPLYGGVDGLHSSLHRPCVAFELDLRRTPHFSHGRKIITHCQWYSHLEENAPLAFSQKQRPDMMDGRGVVRLGKRTFLVTGRHCDEEGAHESSAHKISTFPPSVVLAFHGLPGSWQAFRPTQADINYSSTTPLRHSAHREKHPLRRLRPPA